MTLEKTAATTRRALRTAVLTALGDDEVLFASEVLHRMAQADDYFTGWTVADAVAAFADAGVPMQTRLNTTVIYRAAVAETIGGDRSQDKRGGVRCEDPQPVAEQNSLPEVLAAVTAFAESGRVEREAKVRAERQARIEQDIADALVSEQYAAEHWASEFRLNSGATPPPLAWRGYPLPDESEDPESRGYEADRPIAIAHLGGSLFIKHRRWTTDAHRAWAQTHDEVHVIGPCGCGQQREDHVWNAAVLGDVLASIRAGECINTCAKSLAVPGWADDF